MILINDESGADIGIGGCSAVSIAGGGLSGREWGEFEAAGSAGTIPADGPPEIARHGVSHRKFK
jgi:hypothetical protein